MDDRSEFLKVAQEAALETGQLLKQNIDKENEVSYKGKVDLVTKLDILSQRMIYSRLSAAFPNHGFLAEEGLSRDNGGEYRWIIDPLDGTTNYAHRFPIFTVSIGLERNGEAVVGVVYDPTRQEMFWGVEGGGAYLNGKKIRISKEGDLDKSLLATGFPYDVRESRANNLDHFSNFLTRAQAIRRCGSATLDQCYVACGRFDGFWELKLHPWDVAAAALIVREAGGKVSDFAGNEFRSFNSEVLATNGLIHKSMMAVLRMGAWS